MRDDDHVPIGTAAMEGTDKQRLQAVDGDTDCPNCGEGVVGLNLTTRGGWGYPEEPASDYCKECGTKFVLALVPKNGQ